MKKLLCLALQYYRILLLYNVLFTVVWLVFAWYGFGKLNIVVWFWAAVCGFWSAVLLHYYTASNTYFYFRNAGVRMRRVILLTFLVDLLIFLIFTAIYYAIERIKG